MVTCTALLLFVSLTRALVRYALTGVMVAVAAYPRRTMLLLFYTFSGVGEPSGPESLIR